MFRPLIWPSLGYTRGSVLHHTLLFHLYLYHDQAYHKRSLCYIVDTRPLKMGQRSSPETSNTKHPLTWGSTTEERTPHLHRCERLTGNVRNTKYCHRGKAICITHSVCVSVLLAVVPGTQIASFLAVLYCHLWPRWLSEIVPNRLINCMIFGKILLNIKCEFWFSLPIMPETFIVLWII
jgi:hypothetical protein